MKFWYVRKEKKWITLKEFGQRWSRGVEGVTLLQQVQSQLVFTIITMIGLLCGIVVSIYKWSSLWWLGIILIAGLGNTIVGLIGIWQKYKQLKRIEDMIKQEKKEVNE